MRDAADKTLAAELKARLFGAISRQIDAIDYVPEDLASLVGDFTFDAAPDADPAADAAGADDRAPLAPDGLARRVNDYYDAAFYDRSGIMGLLLEDTQYRNIGYWDARTTTQQAASERLQDALLAFIPEKTGRILDVACGLGASTRRLLEHYPPDDVWAINISEKQIASTRANAPGVHAEVMNAVDLTFDDGFFDAVMCIEAAFHFETRRRFLENALRVLKPGGRLVLSDVLFTSAARHRQYPVLPDPANHLATAEAYRALLADVGFGDAVAIDARDEIWGAHFRHVVARVHEALYRRQLGIVQLTDILWTYYQLDAVTGPCLLVHATK